ncbi:hypothetical protein [Nocardia sp. NPDC127526]|uniref:hypothetical protein n=1 Tax=Nocardia sp. NPDC127526 TaxID=3345393 RepID=UPI00362DEC48
MTTPSGQGPLDIAVSEVLRGTALGPALDRPINDILREMGLPALPQLPSVPPLPELPPLPVIDLSALTRPLTDIAASFGTGQLGQIGQGIDPSKALEGVSTALTTIMSIAQSVMSLASQQWSGQGATGAAEKGAAAATNAAQLQAQNVQEKTVLAGAAGTVATGAAQMTAIITKFVTALTISAPFLATPPGQVFLLSMASETAAEAMAVVGVTRADLTVKSAEMTKAGEKVDVTNAPDGVDSLSQVTQILGMLSPLMSAATTGAQTVQQTLESIAAEQTVDTPVEEVSVDQPFDGGLGAGGAGVPLGAIAGAAPLSQWTGARTVPAGTSTPAPVAEPVSTPRNSTAMGPGGMVPPMGAGMHHRGGIDESDTEVRTELVTAEHGDEVVGELGNTGVPVVGAVGAATPKTTT